MEMQELMIGNFVKFLDDEIYEVVELKHRIVVFIKNVDEESKSKKRCCLLKSILPILITIEWLVMNGFEKRHEELLDYYYYIKKTKDCLFIITIREISGGYFKCFLDNNALQSYAYADIQYIHQLQNLLNILNIKEDFIV